MADRELEAIQHLAERMRGRKLPGERELAEQFHLSRARVRTILAALETRGLVQRRHGSGTYAVEQGTSLLSTVALLVDEKLRLGDDPFFSLVIERLQQGIQAEGMRCMIERIGPASRPVILEDAVITVGLAGRQVLERLARKDPPAVGLFIDAAPRPGARVSVLDLDNAGAGRKAAEDLLSAGCQKLAYVGQNGLPVSATRLGGAQAAARQAGATLRIIDSGMNYTAGLSAAQSVAQLLNGSADRPIGIIAANDWLALGLRSALLAQGPQRRGQFHLLSFDGLPITADPALGIRSLSVPLDEMTQDAISELRRLAAHPAACGRSIHYPMNWPT